MTKDEYFEHKWQGFNISINFNLPHDDLTPTHNILMKLATTEIQKVVERIATLSPLEVFTTIGPTCANSTEELKICVQPNSGKSVEVIKLNDIKFMEVIHDKKQSEGFEK